MNANSIILNDRVMNSRDYTKTRIGNGAGAPGVLTTRATLAVWPKTSGQRPWLPGQFISAQATLVVRQSAASRLLHETAVAHAVAATTAHWARRHCQAGPTRPGDLSPKRETALPINKRRLALEV